MGIFGQSQETYSVSAEQDVQQADGGWVVWERGGGLLRRGTTQGELGRVAGCIMIGTRLRKGLCRAGGRVGRAGF